MLTLTTRVASSADVAAELVLPFELREKSRLRATLPSGEVVAIFTERGSVLRDGDLLCGIDGRVIRIRAAQEATCRIQCATPRALLQCAFHLGNRHVQAQVDVDFLRIRHDPVLVEMLLGLGATVIDETAPFEPERGAYGGGHVHRDDGNPLAPVALRQRIHRPSQIHDTPDD